MMCSRACGSGLRFKCVGVGKVITMGTFVCSGCRLDDMRATQPTTRDVRRMATEQMMLELTLKKESTARGHLSVETTQSHFLNERLKGGGSIAKPVDNPAMLAACSSGWRRRDAGRNWTASS